MKTIDHLNEVIALIERFGLTDSEIVVCHGDEYDGTLHLTREGAQKTGLTFKQWLDHPQNRRFETTVGNVRVCYIGERLAATPNGEA